ncbi:DUF1289 domain-containing protein [Aquabacterium sp. A3]|uniref:DUF1289 domain-containing protein n=1 Tax=Aquabacterium sp. A3 TaxID=3132829 RepID=UPI00311A1393
MSTAEARSDRPAGGRVPSPCRRLCTLNEQDVCVGCGRTLTDITGWTAMSDEEQRACVARARARVQQLRPRWAPDAGGDGA